MVKQIHLTPEEREGLNKIAKEASERFLIESLLKREEGMYKGPEYDEDYLKTLEERPKGKKFTEEELDFITDRAYPGIKREEHLWNYDHSEEQGYDKKYRPPLATEERVRAIAKRQYGPESPDNSSYKNFYDLAMGLITPREFHRRLFKRMLKRRYEN